MNDEIVFQGFFHVINEVDAVVEILINDFTVATDIGPPPRWVAPKEVMSTMREFVAPCGADRI